MSLFAAVLVGVSLSGSAAAPSACSNVEPALGKDRGILGMVKIEGGSFEMGSNDYYPEERPPRQQTVGDFWIDSHEVTNAQFAEFVAATQYVTLAERQTDAPPGSAIFVVPEEGGNPSWWRYVEGANWRQPEGPESTIEGKPDHPVVHIALADAQAYAKWLGRELPSEAEWEYAAGGQLGPAQANTWQGFFPFSNAGEDGHTGTAPVGCYEPNSNGLFDMIGNVWELTSTPGNISRGAGPSNIIKGGSFLCAANFCRRYRATARQSQEHDLGTSHVGFRTLIKIDNSGAVSAESR